MTIETLNFLAITFGPALCLLIGYIVGRCDEAKERDGHQEGASQ